MKILVYGAGVIGCKLAHMLIKAKNDVTLLARGKWRENIDKNGLIIRHYARFRTTCDTVSTIQKLEPQDIYDLIFVVMQHGQVKSVLPEIAANKSAYVIFVGNNMNADQVCTYFEDSPNEKEIAFGFQATGGRREKGKVISVYAKVAMTIGGLNKALSQSFEARINEAFKDIRYRLTKEDNMDSWLKCHVAFICYATDFNLAKSTKKQLNMAIDAAIEGYNVLKELGYSIRPEGSDESLINSRKQIEAMLWIMAKTPSGDLPQATTAKILRGKWHSLIRLLKF